MYQYPNSSCFICRLFTLTFQDGTAYNLINRKTLTRGIALWSLQKLNTAFYYKKEQVFQLMKIKRCIASVTAAAFCAAMVTGTASAHSNDVFADFYYIMNPSTVVGGSPTIVQRTTADFVLMINPSAFNSVLTYEDVYSHGTDWNGISSNVDLRTVNNSSGKIPSVTNQINVEGENLPSPTGYIRLGYTFPFDINHNQADPNFSWFGAKIIMNNSEEAELFYSLYDAGKLNRRKVFVHEVGHALKLKHPIQKSTVSGHTIDGYPLAIMNQGSPYEVSYASATITQHDKDCLKEKWGA